MKQTLLFLIVLLSVYKLHAQDTMLLREPTVHGDEVVFIYANDLWRANINDEKAQRLTSHEGMETAPHFSNDGKYIAFSAQYDGNLDVYVIPAEGGTPQRMTYHSSNDVVNGWTPDGKILFRSDRESAPTQTNKFFTIGLQEKFPKAMKLDRAAYGEISRDGKYVAYTPITSWDPEWRNYRGGQAMPIWIVDLKTMELKTTPQPDKERHLYPVWLDGVVYYLSERDYASNIWSFDPDTKAEKQITQHKKFDVKSLDSDGTQIVYEQGGRLHTINPKTMQQKTLSISVDADLNDSRPRWEKANGRQFTNVNLSPKGERLIVEHRGDIITIPKEDGTYRNLTNSSTSAERHPAWSPDGNKIAYFSDKSGEYQLIITDQRGTVKKNISFEEPTFYFKPEWSPDGEHLAFTDTHYNVWVVNVGSGKPYKIAADSYAHPNRSLNPVWSPDGKWLAFAKQQQSHFKAIYCYNIDTKKTVQITDPIADAITPIWDEGGEYLYTLASTDYGLASGWLDMSSYDPSTTRQLYAIVLKKDGKAPHLPLSNEEKEKLEEEDEDNKENDKKTDKKDGNKKDDAVKVVIDQDGIYNRAVALNLPAGNYVALEKAPKGHVFIAQQIDGENGLKLHRYSIEKKKAEDYADGINRMSTSHDRKSLALQKGSNWIISSTTGKPDPGEDTIDSNISIKVDPREEYAQIFKEGWRYMRDFLYVDNVHGAPWNEVYEWYSPWIKYVRHRSDLNYVVDIMSGEVAIGHSYVSGGDFPDVDYVNVGLLGVDLEPDGNRYRIKKIYSGEQWNPDTYSPLGMAGIDANEGDYLISFNGKELTTDENPFMLLENTANREIYVEVSKNKNGKDTRELLVKPVSSERGLRYVDWVEGNRRKVDELSNGQLAYVYIPNTSGGGFTSFNRYYFGQQNKKGVVIDERNNGGGSAADYMIDILKREPMGYFNSKAGDRKPWTTPMAGIFGPKVMIINERAGSGGDLLPYMFKQQDLGPLVGTRTWGGLVGTWDTPPFIDGGRMVAPRGGFYDLDGNWAVEGKGVAPDIEVIQEPKLTAKGNDPQLERAVKEAMKLLKTDEFKFKPEPKGPVRWKRPVGYEKDK